MQTTLIELKETNPMQRKMNEMLMVRWINNGLPKTAAHDISKSFCFYDADKDFVFAMSLELSEYGRQALFETTKIRYWSKGIV